jgi:hypothetical protein
VYCIAPPAIPATTGITASEAIIDDVAAVSIVGAVRTEIPPVIAPIKLDSTQAPKLNPDKLNPLPLITLVQDRF